MWEKLLLLIRKIFLSITRIEYIGISILEASKSILAHYSIIARILIFMIYFMILGIPNFIIILSHESRPIYVMVQYDSIANPDIMLS